MPKKSPQPLIRKLHMTESTGGHFVEDDAPAWRKKLVEKAREQKRTGHGVRLPPEQAKAAEGHLEQQILRGDHPLALDPLKRLEIREWWKEGIPVHEIASQTGTSITLVKRVIAMKEKLLSKHEREELLARKFLEASTLVSRILAAVTDEKLERSSFSQLALGMGISMDKMLMIRKSIDGDAPEQVEMGIHLTRDPAELRERIQHLFDQNPRLRALVQAEEVKVIEEKTVNVEKVLDNQIPLFQDQESKLLRDSSRSDSHRRGGEVEPNDAA